MQARKISGKFIGCYKIEWSNVHRHKRIYNGGYGYISYSKLNKVVQ